MTNTRINRHSARVTEDISQAGSRALLYAAGLAAEDFHKAQVGIASTGFESNPCNMHLNDLADDVKKGVEDADLVGWVFHTIGVSDGIANGTSGMNFSLPSRDVIADSIETMTKAHFYDANISVVGCDKNMPGSVMAMSRIDRPSIMVYGGTIQPGHRGGCRLDIVSAFEAYGQYLSQQIDKDELEDVVAHSCPGPGACGGMYTANTMAAAIETLGMSLPYSSSVPAVHPKKREECRAAGRAIRHLLEQDIRPSRIMTRRAFENAITIVMVLGGSTNSVLHLLAMARTAGVDLTLDDFRRIADDTPVLGDLRPSGKYLMEDLFEVGGVPAVQKLLLREGLLVGDGLTVTGKTLAENVADLPDLDSGQKIIFPFDNPVKATGHIRILHGNVAPEGAVAKITGKEGVRFAGPARVFDSEEACQAAILSGDIQEGDVIVIRYVGPKGGPGMPEMLKVTSAIVGAGLAKKVAMVTDGRFSGGSHGFVVGHVTPEAQVGGPIAALRDGDHIAIDAVDNRIEADISADDLSRRLDTWEAPPPKHTRGMLAKYARLVSSASKGCVTDE